MSAGAPEFTSKFKSRRQVFHLPANFSPEQVLPRGLLRYSDHARWIVHRIVWHRHRRDRQGYVRLKRRYLEKFVPERILSRLLEALKLARVIECDNQYIPRGPNHGGKAFGYRLGPAFDHAEINYVPVTNGRLAGKMCRDYSIERSGQRRRSGVIRHLAKALEKVTIAPEAKQIAETFAREKQIGALRNIRALEHRVFAWKTSQYRRLFTNITKLNRELRPYLQFQGEFLTELDISNSQPLLLALWLIHNRLRKRVRLRAAFRGCSTWTRITIRNLPENHTEITDTLTCSADEVKFIERVQDGTLYELLAQESQLTREDVKEAFWPQVLFGKAIAKGPVKRAFKRLFPTVLRKINAAKRQDYRHVAQTLQRMEADIVLYRVCRRIMIERPEIDLLTVHDSWLCLPQHQDYVRHVAEEEFWKLGVRVSLKIKPAIQA